MFNTVEKEISEILYKDPYKCCIMGIHRSDNDIYTIYVRNDLITRDGYIKSQAEYDACRISLLHPKYVDLGCNIKLTKREINRFNNTMHDIWKDIVSIARDFHINLTECPDYSLLK